MKRRMGVARLGAIGSFFLVAPLGWMASTGCSADNACDVRTEACEDGTGASGGEGGTSGGGGEGGGTPTECLPSMAAGAIPESCGVFVDASDGDDSNGGSQVSPFATMGKALSAAKGKPVYVCAASAGHEEVVALTKSQDLFGGLDCETWQPGSGQTNWTAAADEIPLMITGAETDATIEGFAITAQDAEIDGGSSIAVLVAEATVDFANVAFTAGAGRDGVDGETASDDIGGVQGEAGGPGTNAGGPGGVKLCDGMSVQGGQGGGGTAGNGSPGNNGNPFPGPAAGNGTGGKGADASACQAGAPGGEGESGTPGAGGTGSGALSNSGYAGADGQAGQSAGTPGQGAGGGGGAKSGGPSGGGGGSGGCGGVIGTEGTAGGSSIALASIDATVTINDATLTTANGGNGGDGSAGQEGGLGGIQGNQGGAGACPGGVGGNGGNGGAGGGGQGGHSVGIAFVGDAPTENSVTIEGADAGNGGDGGDSGGANVGGNGDDGQTAERLEM